jgi:hypothetical protein
MTRKQIMFLMAEMKHTRFISTKIITKLVTTAIKKMDEKQDEYLLLYTQNSMEQNKENTQTAP